MTQKNREIIARSAGSLLGLSYATEAAVAEAMRDIIEDLEGVLANEETDEETEYRLIVHCKDCVLHENCITESTFNVSRIEDPFCCVGMRKVVADDE